ncbi:MAG: kinase [Actinobacteria bacterium]|nr:kinase [Actinomycetota bacterium]
MKYFLGIDSGASKTEAIIIDENAKVMGMGRSGVGNFEFSSMEVVKNNWLSAIEKARSTVGNIEFEKACFGLGGADFPEDFEMLKEELESLNIASGGVLLENDTAIALRAGSKDYWGIIIIMGSGTNGYGKKRDGTSYRFYGEGYEFGDWGGGSSVARDILYHAFRSYDGRGEKTILESTVLEFFEEKTYDELANKLYYKPEARLNILDLAPLLFRAIEDGDKVATEIGERIAEETVRDIYALMKRLDFTEEDIPVVLGGSLYKGALWLPEYISAKTHIFEPRANVSLLKVPPALGASIIAWEASGYSLSEDKWEELLDFNC